MQCEGPVFHWDAQATQRSLRDGDDDAKTQAIHEYGGPFPPQAATEWVCEERDRLEWDVIRTGLELMGCWSEAGEYGKCAVLARRLLDIAPCDEARVQYLVLATVQLEALARAQRELQVLPAWSSRLASEPERWH